MFVRIQLREPEYVHACVCVLEGGIVGLEIMKRLVFSLIMNDACVYLYESVTDILQTKL